VSCFFPLLFAILASVASAQELQGVLAPPDLIHFVDAVYPERAIEAGVQGEVRLALTIDARGRVASVELIEGLGHGLDEAGMEAAWQLGFEPAQCVEGPCAVIIEFAYGFELHEETVELPVEPAPAVPAPALASSGADEVFVVVELEREPEVTRHTISMSEVRSIPGTYGDPVRVIQNLPGVARSGGVRGGGQVVIRGANPEDSKFYVDGVEVPIVYHLGNYASVVDADVLEEVEYLPGTTSARYGRATGGVIDLKTRKVDPSGTRVSLDADLLDSSLSAETRLGPVGILASGRLSYLDLWVSGLVQAMSGGGGGGGAGGPGESDPRSSSVIMPRWSDYQVKAELLDVPEQELSLLVFGFGDHMGVESVGESEETAKVSDFSMSYGTHAVLLTYTRKFSDTLSLSLRPYLASTESELDFGGETSMGMGYLDLGLRSQLRWDPASWARLTVGLDGLARKTETVVGAGSGDTGAGLGPTAGESATELDWSGWATTPDVFLDAQIHPLSDRDALMLQPGLRLDSVLLSDGNRVAALDPRLGLRWEAWDGGTVKGGTGLYRQSPSFRELAMVDDITFQYERAWNSELGLEQRLGTSLGLDLTGFYRRMDQLLTMDMSGGLADLEVGYEGVGRAMGLEAMLRHDDDGPFFGWLSYTLSRSERDDSPSDPDSSWVLFDYDQTHILTAVGAYRFLRGWELSSRFQYVTGNPYTPYDGGIYDQDTDRYTGILADEENSARVPDYYSLDLRVQKGWEIGRTHLDIYAEVLGLVAGENPEDMVYNYDYTEPYYVMGLPMIPSVGARWEAEF
jgi:TonB family protein